MTEWKLRIFMWGMIAFVLHPNKLRARVFLINAVGRERDEHVPELSFRKGFLTSSPLGIQFPSDIGQSSQDIIWRLKNVDLELRPDPGITLSDQFRVVNGALPTSIIEMPDADNPGTISYLVNLEKLSLAEEVCRINPVCLRDSVETDLFNVRMQLSHGKLGVTRLANNKFWAFAPKGNSSKLLDHQQPCAIEMCCEISVPAGALTVVGKPFDGGPETGMALRPMPGQDRTVVVRLENRPTMGEGLLRVEHGGMDEDFALYYELSSKVLSESKRVLPIDPVDSKFSGIIPRFAQGNCIQTIFSDDEGA
jgi:hypothetical protein